MNILPLIVILPLAGAFIIMLFKFIKNEERRNSVSGITAAVITVLLLLMSIMIFGNESVYNMGGWKIPLGIVLVQDGFSGPIIVIINFIALMCVLFSFDYMSMYNAREKYYALFLLMVAGMNGVVLTGDIFNLYVFLEIATMASYALVGFGTKKQEMEATFKYLILSSIGAIFIFFAIALVYSYTKNLNMAYVSYILSNTQPPAVIYLALAFFIIGFAIKSALVPFHAWLPDAHPSAPAPISAMLSGVLIKAIGIYALIRIGYNVLGGLSEVVSGILVVLGVISLIVGSFLMLGQWDFKRLLAYSSIEQMGFIAIGFALATPLGIIGGLYHLLNHSVFKSLLFLNSGSVFYRTRTRDLRKMGGLRSSMPVTATTSMIASFSIAGIPPFSGFWSKLIIVSACIQAGRPFLAIISVAGSILTLAAFLKVLKYCFGGKAEGASKSIIKESPFWMQVPMIVLAVFCIIMGLLLIPDIRQVVLEPAVKVLMGTSHYVNMVLGL